MSERPFRRLSPLTPVVRGFIVLVAAGWTVFRDVTDGEIGTTALLFLALLLGGAVLGVASWLRTKFWIEADELRIDTGVLSRQSRRIRIDRLQGIDIAQPFVARLFGLAELRMDVAGGKAREGSLAFLTLADARELKDLLLARRDAVRAGTTDAAGGATTAAGPVPAQGEPGSAAYPSDAAAAPSQTDGVQTDAASTAPPAPPRQEPQRLLARVDMQMLALSIVLSPEAIGTFVSVFALLAVFGAVGQMAGMPAALPIVLGMGLVLFRRFSANYRFTVTETPAGLQVRRGMFDLNSQTIRLPRIQGVVITEPVFWRALGWARLDVSIAGYGSSDDEGPAPSTVLPVGDRRTVAWLAQYLLAGLDADQVPLYPPGHNARWVEPFGRHFLGLGASDRLAVSREGWLVRRTHVAPHARVQSVRITQGPVQRRLGLADVHVDSPPGPTVVRGRQRDAGDARLYFDVAVAVGREERLRRAREEERSSS